jgi:ParB-like chromosome segregation protein Spo0J
MPKQAPTITMIDTDSLIPYVNNARTHSQEQINQIAASIKEFGFINPVIIDGDKGIIAGHGRVQAAQKLGMAEVPCVQASHLTEAQKKAYILADNKLALNAGWDDELLRLELQSLDDLDFDLELTGFDLEEIEALEPLDVEELDIEEQAIPEPQEDPISKLGDVWVLGNHRLMCGDSTSVDDVEKLMDGQKADMVFTDPPYGIGLDKEGQKLGKSKAYGAVLNDHDTNVAVDAFNLAKSLCDGVIFFWGANHYSHALPGSPCWIVWDKQGGKRVTFADVELCYSNIDAPARLLTHIWDGFRRDSEKGDKRVHPTQKPVQMIVEIWELFEKHISGSAVLDLFGGSGSTLIACEKTKRKCFMMELDPKYCDVIIKRWQNLTSEQAILEATGEPYAKVASHA